MINWQHLIKATKSLAKSGYTSLKYKLIFSNDSVVESTSSIQEFLNSIWLTEENSTFKIKKIMILGAKDKLLYSQEAPVLSEKAVIKSNHFINDFCYSDKSQREIFLKIITSSLSFYLYA